MKQLYTALLVSLSITAGAQSISTTGSFTFNPAVLTVTAGTPIALTIGGPHTMTEVSQATWNANGTTSNGGFNYSGGSHTLTLTIPGTYYYVCVPHVASMGMKGQIIVETNTGIDEMDKATFSLFPNPVSSELHITGTAGHVLRLIDAQGREALRYTLTGNDVLDVTLLQAGNYAAILSDPQGTIISRDRLSIVR